jgi:multidrug efflux pump subunit AcrB
MIKRFSERYQTILDRYTTERIIFTGIFLVFCLGLILFGGIGVSLGSQLEQRMQTRAKLNDQIAKAEATWLETQKRMIETSDLPEAATFLKDCFISNGLSLEELVITPLSIHDQGYSARI